MNKYNKRIIYIVKDTLHAYPPCISQIVMLCELGFDVYVITEVCDEAPFSVIKSAGAKVKLLGNLITKKNFIGRIKHWISFKAKTMKEIKKLYRDGDVIWLGTETTGIVIGNCLKSKKTVLNVLELSTRESTIGKFVGKIIGNMQVIVACELNRARIMKLWYNLKELPFIMPNKPYYALTCEETEDVKAFKRQLEGKKYILYQGGLNLERRLDIVAHALNNTKEHYTFVIIGSTRNKKTDEMIMKQLKSIYPDVVYGGYFPAPQHLYITENAHIGIAFYDTSSINTMFCAPNKTFEYAQYDVPILGSNIPGLQLTVEKLGAGICADIENIEEITKAIDDIESNYTMYQNGCRKLLNSVDNLHTMKEIVKKLELI